MYLNGLQVSRDVSKALYYFKRKGRSCLWLLGAADLRRADGNFNYGSLFLLPSTREIDRNAKLAFHHLNMAASQGHPHAQYSLALMFLDGTDIEQNCEVAAKLLH